MKKSSLLLLLIIGLSIHLSAQTFQNGLDLYDQGDYERAIKVLSQSNEPEALLFIGKSYFALNNNILALSYLNKITMDAPGDIYQDALYTSALANFQIKNFAKSLDILNELSKAVPSTNSSRSATILYDQILGYLTLDQRRNSFLQTTYDNVRFDLIESALGRIKYGSAVALVELYKRSVTQIDPLQLSRINAMLSDSVVYTQRYNPDALIKAPNGLSYNLGVVLPQFEFDTPEYEIAQHIYFGIQLAVEEFNSQNVDQKAFLHYRTSNNGDESAEIIVNDLVWNEDVDIILGPLFSGVAKSFSKLAEEYNVPMLLPLANADDLDLFNNYVFQLNPSFATQGKLMAQYAVTNLGFDTLGVISEKGSLGAPAARAFMHEAERLGAFVDYYFEENFEELGYDIRDYTKYFTTDPLDSVDMVEAVYAPFTGSVAPTLVESFLTDLEAMRSTVAILGSEEWMNVNLEDRRLSKTELYYTESFKLDSMNIMSKQFASSFRLRFSVQPNEFAYIGYDAAQVILQTLLKVKNPELLRDALKDVNNYKGLSTKVSFRGTHVNQEVNIYKMPSKSDDSMNSIRYRR